VVALVAVVALVTVVAVVAFVTVVVWSEDSQSFNFFYLFPSDPVNDFAEDTG